MRWKKSFKLLLCSLNSRIQRSRKRTRAYITCSGNADGAGAQAHAVLSTMVFARLYGLQYVHTPFRRIEHRPSTAADWEARWERFFNLGASEKNVEELAGTIRQKLPLKHPLTLWKKKDVLYTVRNCHEATDVRADAYADLLELFKQNFFTANAWGPVKTDLKFIRIALHIRRGDVSRTQNAERFTPFDRLSVTVDTLIDACSGNGFVPQVHVYSQGEPSGFREWDRYPVTFHLNEDECCTFRGLVTADVLVMAKSSFSYMAACLSEGFVVYDRFWHPPLRNWTVMDKEPDLLRKQFTAFLLKRKNA